MVGLIANLSPHSFAERQRAKTSSLVYGALVSDDADEIEDERDVRDESEIIDSGEDAVDTELASDDRPRLMDELLPKQFGMLVIPGEGSRSALDCGVRRGVGSNPSAGGRRHVVCEGDGAGSMTAGML
ncbi:hypothetical protein VPNG_02847 [Cytospora leucostoma]|uniref:Uncharacterized protein n=1 Tax=Cytospora leucostoma TaxID=1230097 RepID=A0A423XJ28_9PEZI|nr:hypothetical protein VPNG_02847 [Cytospora leucostoma]